MARQRFEKEGFELGTLDEIPAKATFDLAFCNGVFHHIPLEARAASAQLVHAHLRTDGLFAFFRE